VCAVAVGAWSQRGTVTVYGVVAFGLLAVKVGLSLWPPRYGDPPRGWRVVAIVPVWNEDPAIVDRTIRSLLRQAYPVARVVVVDDGSDTLDAWAVADAWSKRESRVEVLRNPVNVGKREAMARAIRLAPDADAYLGVDSDTVVAWDSVWEGLRPFGDPRTVATTGLVTALNPTTNLLTRLVDLRYVNAFLIERGAYSALGSVLCCCGSLAFYRGDLVRLHLDDFVGQTFRGRLQVFGDDRHMTNLLLQHGLVRLARQSTAATAVPERVGHYVRQQIRWGKSFFRESLWSLRHLSARRWAWWLAGVEVLRWAVFVGMVPFLAWAVTVHGPDVAVTYAWWVVLASYAHSVQYLQVEQPGLGWWWRIGTFALAPLYGALAVLILAPLRVWSLATIGRGGWGTRRSVEVSLPAA
jgi:hyaluronan synthase